MALGLQQDNESAQIINDNFQFIIQHIGGCSYSFPSTTPHPASDLLLLQITLNGNHNVNTQPLITPPEFIGFQGGSAEHIAR